MGVGVKNNMFDNIIGIVHKRKPLIHSITNYVSMNDCANILLACGGAAIMAEDALEVRQITAICDGLNLNIGMLNENKLEAMLVAGRSAAALHHPVVLDPVGAGASDFRNSAALRIIKEISPTVIRGNISEIKALAVGMADINHSKGVEANDIDRITEDDIYDVAAFAKTFAKKTAAVLCITGVIDIVTDGNVVYCIRNGHPMMSRVTGSGCQLSALITAYIAAISMENVYTGSAHVDKADADKADMCISKEHDTAIQGSIAKAVAAAVCVMGISGETAYKRLNDMDGNATYRNYVIDAVYNMTDDMLERLCRVEVIRHE